MQTDQLFSTDAYLRRCEARVLDIDPDARRVALDRTVFYPGGGGQPPDAGTLTWGDGEAQVVKAARDGRLIWHVLAGDALPDPGADVMGEIDWAGQATCRVRTWTCANLPWGSSSRSLERSDGACHQACSVRRTPTSNPTDPGTTSPHQGGQATTRSSWSSGFVIRDPISPCTDDQLQQVSHVSLTHRARPWAWSHQMTWDLPEAKMLAMGNQGLTRGQWCGSPCNDGAHQAPLNRGGRTRPLRRTCRDRVVTGRQCLRLAGDMRGAGSIDKPNV